MKTPLKVVKNTHQNTRIYKSQAAKDKVGRNALAFGLRSPRTILPNEDPEDYIRLLDTLSIELMPWGVVEGMLVERIAVAIVRLKRIQKAENAYLALQQTPKNIAAEVSN